MADETLPPVVGVLKGDISDWLASLAEAAEAAEAFAGDLDGMSFGMSGATGLAETITATLSDSDIGAGLGDALAQDIGEEFSSAIGSQVGGGSDELTSGLSESVAGIGDALGEQIGTELADAIADSAERAGAELRESLVEGTVGTGDAIGQSIVHELTDALNTGGSDAARELRDGIEEGVAGAGAVAGTEVAAGLLVSLLTQMAAVGLPAGTQLAEGIAEGAADAGDAVVAAVRGPLVGSAAGIGATAGDVLAAGIVEGAADAGDAIARGMAGSLMDAAGETGSLVGAELGAMIADTAKQTIADADIGEALAGAGSQAAEAGGVVGVSFAEAMGDAVAAGTDEVANEIDDRVRVISADAIDAFTQRFTAPDVRETIAVSLNESVEGGVDQAVALMRDQGLATLSDAALDQFMIRTRNAAEGVLEGLGVQMGQELSQAEIEALNPAQLEEYLLNQEINQAALIRSWSGPLGAAAAQAAEETGAAFEGALGNAMAETATVFDAVERNVSTLGVPLKSAAGAAEETGGALEGAGESAAKATSSFGGMAGMMMGPWGMALMMGMSLLPELGGMFDSTAAKASDFTSAVSQDSDMIGANTEATIQSTLAKQDLSSIESELGASEAQLIEYASGDQQVQQQLAATYNSKTQALAQASTAEGIHSKAEFETGNAADQEMRSLAAAKGTLDQVTSAVAQAVAEQTQQNEALLAAEKATNVFNAAVHAQVVSMQQSAEQYTIQQAAINQAAPAVDRLSASILRQMEDTNSASASVQQWSSAVQDAMGNNLSASESVTQFDGDILNLTSTLKSNKFSLDDNTKSGNAVMSAFEQAAGQAISMSNAMRQDGASAETANSSLQTSATRIDNVAREAGATKTQIEQLNKELFGVPKVKDIKVSADTSPAKSALGHLLSQIDSSEGVVRIVASKSNPNPIRGAKAEGGPVLAGESYLVGEEGPEVVTFGASGFVTPNDRIYGGYGTGALGSPLGAAGSGTPVFNINVTVQGSLASQNDLIEGVQRGILEANARNSNNGLTFARGG